MFDMDGTLYSATLMRVGIMLELLGFLIVRPFEAVKVIRVLRCFRIAHERLRTESEVIFSLELQIEETARMSGCSVEDVNNVTNQWFFERSLKHVGNASIPGLVEVFEELQHAGVQICILSDYPVVEKLRVIGVSAYVAIAAASCDVEVASLKPSPAGLKYLASKAGVEVGSVIMVGDRDDTDGAAARAAGCSFIRFRGTAVAILLARYVGLKRTRELQRRIIDLFLKPASNSHRRIDEPGS